MSLTTEDIQIIKTLLKEEINPVRKEVKSVQKELSSVQKEVKLVQEGLSSVQKEVKSVKTGLNLLQEEMNFVQKKVGLFGNELNLVREELKSTKVDLKDEIKSAKEALQGEIRENTNILKIYMDTRFRETKALIQESKNEVLQQTDIVLQNHENRIINLEKYT